jgi:aryl-alcohol dehydrogenase-like predicted oxidoreductase
VLDIALGSGFRWRKNAFQKQIFLKVAFLCGIKYFDTAQQYEGGEEFLGANTSKRYLIITKIGLGGDVTSEMSPELRWGNYHAPNLLGSQFEISLKRLNRSSCYGLLLHCVSDEFDFEDHVRELQALKRRGLVEKIGFSIDKGQVFPSAFSWADIIQIHVSHLRDRRFSPSQSLMVNGVFRDNQESLFTEFSAQNPDSKLVLVIGTHRFDRLLLQTFKYKLIARRLKARGEP